MKRNYINLWFFERKQASEKMIKDQQELMNKIKKESFNYRKH